LINKPRARRIIRAKFIMSETSIILNCTNEQKGAAKRAAYPGKLAEWALEWINTGVQLSENAPVDLPPYLIADNPATGDLYALHTQRPRCLIRLIETDRGYIAQPVESYEPMTQSAQDLARILRGAEDAASE